MMDHNPNLSRRVNELELSYRATQVLERAGLLYIGDVVRRTQAELLALEGFGRNALRDLRFLLAEVGLDVGLGPVQWRLPTRTRSAKALTLPPADFEWDQLPGGVVLFLGKRLVPKMLAQISEEPAFAIEDVIFEANTNGDEGYFFDDSHHLRVLFPPEQCATALRNALPYVFGHDARVAITFT
jgi:hypothetical protein